MKKNASQMLVELQLLFMLAAELGITLPQKRRAVEYLRTLIAELEG